MADRHLLVGVLLLMLVYIILCLGVYDLRHRVEALERQQAMQRPAFHFTCRSTGATCSAAD